MSWFKRLSYRGDKDNERRDSPSPNPSSSNNLADSSGAGYSSAAAGSSSHGAEHDKKTGMFHDDEPDNDEPPPAYSAVPPGFSAPSTAPASSYPPMYMPVSSIHHIFSPTNNASYGSYNAGSRFCAEHPLAPPLVSSSPESLTRIQQGIVTMSPESPHKNISITLNTSNGFAPTSTIKITKRNCPDSTILSQVPLYLARYHHPSVSNPTVVFGYNLSIIGLPLDGDSVIAMGFACVPYPQYRLPGWHRGSLAIHSDDGRRYCNDGFGGQEFTRPVLEGENITLGIIYRWVPSQHSYPPGRVEGEVVFIRNGRREGVWNIREEPPAGRQDPKIGFLAERDVFAAVGVTGGRGVECVMKAMGRNEAWLVIMGEEPLPPSYDM